MRLRVWLKVLPGVMLALLAATALAGGVVVTLDNPVTGVEAGQPFDVDFSIVSAHDGTLQEGWMPMVTATDPETGEVLSFTAQELEAFGHYRAAVTLPKAGVWRWHVHPDRYSMDEMVTALAPLTVAPAGSAAAASGGPAWLGAPQMWAAVTLAGLLALAGAAAVVRRRRALPEAR
jgi:hypothetical protein